MKTYTIALSVPDDFDPQKLGIDLSYDEDIEIKEEGFFDLDQTKELITVFGREVTENSIVTFSFPPEALNDPIALNLIREQFEAQFGCPAVGYVNSIDLLVQNADDAIAMFEKMIAKVKTRAAVKDTAKIVLPN